MNWFLNLSTRAKLFVGFAGMLAIFAILIAVAYSSIKEIHASEELVATEERTVVELNKLKADYNEGRLNVMMILILTNRLDQQQWTQDLTRSETEIDEILNNLAADAKGNPTEFATIQTFRKDQAEYRDRRIKILSLANQGQIEEARRLSANEQTQHYLRLRGSIDQIIKDAEAEAAKASSRAESIAQRSIQIFLIIGLGSMVLGVIGITALAGVISNPLNEILGVAERISLGDLTATIQTNHRTDEVGVLSRSFRRMTESMRELNRDIQEGVNVLASSASEIFTATSQIAASASETATAVSQTTTTVEEVKQTAQISAQKANHVADVAQNAVQAAQSGRKSVDDAVAGMQRIRTQMESIAESIVRLSDQSQAIGEIIATVNDLAEQSNLLAVNASIEASKAGEHGKGFAVVAQEIRNLATQSKQATGQVRSILSDIQKATTAAVMATEQGTKAVDAGVRQANLSGDAIRTLSESIASAAQAATQIMASSQQQLIGVDQVAVAMENILQASKQNATGTQQAEAGARNLSELGQKLKSVVHRYKV